MLDIAQSPVEKPSVRAPLLWILVPQILGYAAALNWELSPVICLLSGSALSLKALRICRNSSYNQFHWALCLSGSVILLSWAWYQECDPLIRDSELLKLPPRAVEIRKGMRCSSAAGRSVAVPPCSWILGRYKTFGADKNRPMMERFDEA